MSTRRLGNTVFDDTDPLDDLRPSKGRKLIPPAVAPAAEAPRPEAEKVIEVELQGRADAPPPLAPTAAAPVPEAVARPPLAEPEDGDEGDDAITADVTGGPKPKRQATEGQGKSPRKIRFSANISVSTKERADNAAYWVPGLNLSALTEMALEKELRKLEREFNNGEPFKPAGSLKYGRPRG